MRPELLLNASPASRFRRRVLVVGLLVAALVAAIGAPFYLRAVERDLERRVPTELADLGHDGITASFSGQTGELWCDAPLADPEGVLDRAYEITGVVAVELDRSCRVAVAPTIAPPRPEPPPATTVPSSAEPSGTSPPPVDEPADDVTGDVTGEMAVPAFDHVTDALRSSPRLSVFSTIVADLDDDLIGELLAGPVTVFAPDNAAFDDVPADVLAELRARPELLVEVLAHHAIDGAFTLADLADRVDGADGAAAVLVTPRAGQPYALGRVAGAITVAGASVSGGDLAADDGVVHVIDRFLLPDGLDLPSLSGLPELVAVLRDGGWDLGGTVGSADDRARVLAAATSTTLTDEAVVVDPADAPPDPAIDRFVALLDVAPTALTGGSVGVDGGEVFVRGTVVDDDGRAALAAAAPGAVLELTDRPVAGPTEAIAVAAELAAILDEEPIRFAPASAEPDAAARATLDRLASVVKRYAGLVVTVEGYTDTRGDPAANLALGELRAAVVHLELVSRGVPGEQVEHVGRGGNDPVVVDGIEDVDASRRIEFVVGLADPTG